MHDAGGMGHRQRLRDLIAQPPGFPQRNCGVQQPLAQRLAVDKFLHDETAAFLFSNFVNRDNVRMIQRRGDSRFPFKSLQPVRVAGEFGGQNLDSHFAAQAQVTRAVNLAHPTGAKGFQYFV